MSKSCKNITKFYTQGFLYAQKIQQMCISGTQADKIEFARKYYKQTVLNNYIEAGILNQNQQQMLRATNRTIKFSYDSLIKNILKHPEITIEEYLNITKILTSPDKTAFSKSHNSSILIFKIEERYYQVVIKNTNNHTENYLTSFIRSNEKEYNRY